jgi:undecaprenyl-diphosphatase
MESLLSLDIALFKMINGLSHPVLDAFMYFVSLLGEYATIYWVLCVILLLLDKKNGRISFLLTFIAIVMSDQVFGHFLKGLWNRPRPFMYMEGIKVLGTRWPSSSFPSGHADALFAGTVILGFFYPRMRWPLYTFCIISCFSRIYCGMHHPLDIIVGTLLGLLTGWAVLAIYRKLCGNHGEEAVDEDRALEGGNNGK